MSFGQRLDLRQSQQLVMTPQLQQAIKMLQMSNLELTEFVAGELERNPLLEPDTRADGPEPERAEPTHDRAEAVDRALGDDRLERATDTFDTGQENLYADEARADRGVADIAPLGLDGPGIGGSALEASAWAGVGKGGSLRFDDADGGLESRVGESVTLREHLLRQLGMSRAAPDRRLIAADLIEQIDDAGYLRGDTLDTAHRLGAAPAAVDSALALIQGFDPTGVGARSLKECLALQLRELDRFDPAMQALMENLELLARRDYAKLRRLCRVDAEDLRQMIADIRALDPKPGAKFDAVDAPPISPDVFVYENRAGGWTVELNTDTLPRLLINNAYAADVARAAGSGPRAKAVKEYVADCQQSANWLLKSIDQRARTILRVASEIVRQQDGFLAYGVSALRPLNLKRVADAIEMHESTVSRVTSNKFVSTPRGVFELKYFFTPAIAATDGGESYSAEAIRHRIRTMIDGEDAEEVLSDDRIVAVLRDAGVDIARRTVAKYREAMGIASSLHRKREKSEMAVL